MRIRYLIALSFGMKFAMFFFCFSLIYAPRIFGQSYFNPSLSNDAYEQAVREARNLNQRNQSGMTGLMQAASTGLIALAEALIKYGANLNLVSQTKDRQTALQFGIMNMESERSRAVANLLIRSFADTTIKNAIGNTSLHLVPSPGIENIRMDMVESLIKNGVNINTQNDLGNTMIHAAVSQQSLDWLQKVLERYGPLIDINIKNNEGLNAAEYANQLGFFSVRDMIKKTKISPIPPPSQFSALGLTGLQLAIMRGDNKLVKQMLGEKRALDMRSRDKFANTPLHIALIHNNIGAALMLLQAGASPVLKNATGAIPADYLVRIRNPKERIQAAAALIKKFPRALLQQDQGGNNLLHYIVRFNDIPLFDFLVRNYKQLVERAMNVKNRRPLLQTPLVLANQMRRRRLAQKLQGLRKFGFRIEG